MTKKAPGKAHRQGISLLEVVRKFPNDEVAETWYVQQRWPEGVVCPHCGSVNVQTGAKHKTMPYRCREKECAKRFSAKTGTVMEGSKLGFQTWMIAAYLMTTSLKSVSSMKLHRDLEITQKTAWYLAHRIRRGWTDESRVMSGNFRGPVEVDESYFGGVRRNMSNAKRRALAEEGYAQGPAGKTVVVGLKDRETNRVVARVVEHSDKATLQGFVLENTESEAVLYSDEAGAYESIPLEHHCVKHSVSEYVRGEIHTNGVESFWSMLKRAHKGTFHKLSPKHLDRYVQEFAGRHNIRDEDTEDQLVSLAFGMDGKRLRYRELIAPNGLDSGARSN